MFQKTRIALLLTFMVPGFAAASSCAQLDYQEMKDMTAADLVAESCEIGDAVRKNFDEGMAALNRTTQPASSEVRQTNFNHCIAQSRRVDRVLESKGITKDAARAICQLPLSERNEAVSKAIQQSN